MADGLVITAKWKTQEVRALMEKLQGHRLHQALSVAVNDSTRQVERKAEQLTSKSLSVTARRAKKGIWIRPYSTASTLTAVIRGSGSVIPLKAYGAKQAGDGVTAKIWCGSVHHPGAFIYGGPDDDRTRDLSMGGHVFVRVGASWLSKDKRGPIRKAKGAAIAEAMAKDAISNANETYGAERLHVNVLRQLQRYTSLHKNKSTRRGSEGKFKKRT
ncbi:hypothetical protein LH464_04315 [Neorhizobium sp. T786]|uniref:hypothetical protein n=1 Tax=Pseudorhizobium xiangyangii TaxID=2883104 RepID=UPI001D001859|nr:hypothetical protein [Neorhizobium xiangyangii]MCB5201702.1 hypothetical protein [Neorhizobium xiangyangii]